MAGKSFLSRASFLAVLCSLIFINGVLSKNHQRVFHIRDAENESLEWQEYDIPRPSGNGPLGATTFEVKYQLYTGTDRPQTFTYNDVQKHVNISYIPNAPWKILIHGFLNNGETTFPTNVRKAYMQRMKENPEEKYNVLVVDWGEGACASVIRNLPAPYHNAAENVESAGQKLGDLLVKFHQENIVIVSYVHLIGHSLGSHVAGQAARRVYNTLGKLIGRISALDPAGPLFWRESFLMKQNPYPRLRRNRVWFLDVYHTSRMFGSKEEMGDVDFYINGGESQPSCMIRPKTPIFGVTIPIYVPDVFLQVCSHNFATDIFAKSIIDKTMKGCTGCYNYEEYKNKKCECEDTPVMGEFVTDETIEEYPIASGTAYISTPEDNTVSSNYLQMLKDKGIFGLTFSGLKALCF